MLQIHQLNMVLLLSPKYMSSKFGGFLVALKTEMPYFRAFPAFFHYSSSFLITVHSILKGISSFDLRII